MALLPETTSHLMNLATSIIFDTAEEAQTKIDKLNAESPGLEYSMGKIEADRSAFIRVLEEGSSEYSEIRISRLSQAVIDQAGRVAPSAEQVPHKDKGDGSMPSTTTKSTESLKVKSAGGDVGNHI